MRVTLLVRTLILAIALLATGCSNSPPSTSSKTVAGEPVEIVVSAAVSLKDALVDIQKSYRSQAPHVTIVYNLGASGALQRQIEQGAPVDLFISAASKQMDELQGKNLIHKDSRKNLVENQLVLVIPQASKLTIASFEELSQGDVHTVALGEVATVPVGQYSQEVLKKLAIWDAVKGKAVFAKDARTVLTYVETGNVDAGLVYKSDAAASTKVKIVATAPAEFHEPILYPIAIVASSKQQQAAIEFLDYLTSSESKRVWERYGFVIGK